MYKKIESLKAKLQVCYHESAVGNVWDMKFLIKK